MPDDVMPVEGEEVDLGQDGTGEGTGTDGTGTGEGGEGGEGGQQGTETTGKAVRDAIKLLSEQSPDHAKILKQLGDTHFRVETAYKAAYATPAEAAAAKSLIEGLGGTEGISQIQERIANADAQDQALSSGDPAVLDSFFKDFPEGAAALAPAYLERLAAANPGALVQAVGPYAIGLLENVNFSGYLQALVNETDPAKAKAIASQLLNWYAKTAQGFAQSGQNRPTAGQSSLNKEREKLSNEKEQIFSDAVSAKVTAAGTPALNSEVDKYSKMYKLNDSQKAHFSKTLEQTIVAEMNSDTAYTKQVDLRYASRARTHDSVANYIAGEFNRRVKDKAFEVIKSIYGAPKGGTGTGTGTGKTGVVKPGGTATGPGGQPFKVSTRPKDADLDLNRPGAEIEMIKGRGWLKSSGKYITWR